MRKISAAPITHENEAERKSSSEGNSSTFCSTCLTTQTVLTCVPRDAPQDARQAGQRPAPPAVVELQHGQVLVPDVRRNNQVLQISLVDFRKLVQAQFLQQRLLHILMRKSIDEAADGGAEDTNAEEIHESGVKGEAERVSLSERQTARGGRWSSDPARGVLYGRDPPSRSHLGAGTLIRTKVRHGPNRISERAYFKQQQLGSSAILIEEV